MQQFDLEPDSTLSHLVPQPETHQQRHSVQTPQGVTSGLCKDLQRCCNSCMVEQLKLNESTRPATEKGQQHRVPLLREFGQNPRHIQDVKQPTKSRTRNFKRKKTAPSGNPALGLCLCALGLSRCGLASRGYPRVQRMVRPMLKAGLSRSDYPVSP